MRLTELGFGLDGKHAFVAGVGGGIGSASARTLAAAGARLTCFDIDASVAAAAARALGPEARALDGDARDLDAVRDAVAAAIDSGGPIDVLVDVIGETRWGRTVELDDTAWDESFDLVLRHFFNLVRAVAPGMTDRGRGSIVAIASVSGMRSAPLHGPYGAAKAGLMSLVRTLAVELGASGVRVNAVAPGAVLTPRVEAMMSEARRAESAASIPLGRLATPNDIAHAVTFLASGLAGYVTGQT
ncbi:MAG TPA: SDR family NAD(P)-dependent oxidoreductase, partial [Acidimicrobiia bacterium]|nr:SDR family NAD(P)-dependent oxidoreductase [Acidimicrobiia bacterium]